MIPATFDYVRAGSVDEVIGLLGEHGDDAKLLAGGHSLLPLMNSAWPSRRCSWTSGAYANSAT